MLPPGSSMASSPTMAVAVEEWCKQGGEMCASWPGTCARAHRGGAAARARRCGGSVVRRQRKGASEED